MTKYEGRLFLNGEFVPAISGETFTLKVRQTRFNEVALANLVHRTQQLTRPLRKLPLLDQKMLIKPSLRQRRLSLRGPVHRLTCGPEF